MNTRTKKISVSALVILTFVGYAVEQYQERKNLEANTIVENPQASPQDLPVATGFYKDGVFDGKVTDAYFGDMQAQVTITNGVIVDVVYLKFPNDRPTSIQINTDALPKMKEQVVARQSADIDIVSGATQSAEAFRVSVQDALDKAKI